MSILLALQPWLNILGLLLDFVGILVLAREWGLAFAHDALESELSARKERMRPRPMTPQPQGMHHEMHQDFLRRQEHARQHQRNRDTWAARRRWFTIGFVVIALGYVLQIIAGVPLEPFLR